MAAVPPAISDSDDMMKLLQSFDQQQQQQQPSYILSNGQEVSIETTPTTTAVVVQRSLANIEEQMNTIRNKLEKKSPKITMGQIGQKLDIIIDILKKNGFLE